MKLSALLIFCACFPVLGQEPAEQFESCQRDGVSGSTIEIAKSKCYTSKQASENSNPSKVITVYFIRHAQSKWNKAKEESAISYIHSLIWDKDATLTTEGVKSAINLKEFIFSDSRDAHRDDRIILNKGNAIFATSNLRRAALTLLIAFADRFQSVDNNEGAGAPGTGIGKIHILSALQEIGSGRDAQTHSNPNTAPALTLTESNCFFSKKKVEFDTQCNFGNINKVYKWNYETRLIDFCHWVQNNVKDQHLVVSGHSTWLQKFFKKMLNPEKQPFESKNECGNYSKEKLEKCLLTKDVKLGNGALMKFNLKFDSNGKCTIVGGSSEILHGGLEIK